MSYLTAYMHVRQATLKRCVIRFSSQIEWHNLRTDRKGNAKSALALIGTDTLPFTGIIVDIAVVGACHNRFIAQGDGRINIIYRQRALLYAVGDDLLIPEQITPDADNDINKIRKR